MSLDVHPQSGEIIFDILGVFCANSKLHLLTQRLQATSTALLSAPTRPVPSHEAFRTTFNHVSPPMASV